MPPSVSKSGNSCSNTSHSDFHPASEALVCLGWLRLYQTILLSRSRTRYAKGLPHRTLILGHGVSAAPTSS